MNQYIFRYWQLAKGEFAPGKPHFAYLTIGEDDVQTIRTTLANKKYKEVCVNDDPSGLDFEEEQKVIREIFDQQHPNPSAYEKYDVST